jgi:hypothetical protein
MELPVSFRDWKVRSHYLSHEQGLFLPLEAEDRLLFKHRSYSKENTSCIHCKAMLVSAVQGNNCCLLWESWNPSIQFVGKTQNYWFLKAGVTYTLPLGFKGLNTCRVCIETFLCSRKLAWGNSSTVFWCYVQNVCNNLTSRNQCSIHCMHK